MTKSGLEHGSLLDLSCPGKMAFLAVAGQETTISSNESEVYGAFLDDSFVAKDLEAEILCSTGYFEQHESTRLVQDYNFVNDLSHWEFYDTEGNYDLRDNAIKEPKSLVKISPVPNLDPLCDPWSIQPSGSMLGMCGSSSPEDYSTSVLTEFDRMFDTRDCFPQPVPWLSGFPSETVYTDGLIPDLGALTYNSNSSSGAITTTDLYEVENINSCPSLEHQLSPLCPEVDHPDVEVTAHSMDFMLDEILDISPQSYRLDVDGIDGPRYLNSTSIAPSNLIATANSKHYDTTHHGHISYEFECRDQSSPVEHQLGLDNLQCLHRGPVQKDTAGVSKQYRKSAACRSAHQPALRPKMGASSAVQIYRDIAKASEDHSIRFPSWNQQKQTTHLLRDTHKISKCDQTTQQTRNMGLVRRRFREHEKSKVARVRKLGSCMICRQQKAPVSPTH